MMWVIHKFMVVYLFFAYDAGNLYSYMYIIVIKYFIQ